MRIDTAGNVGVGVTPSAWGAGYKVLDIAGGGGITSLSNGLYLASNGYDNGGWKKKGAGYANLLLNVSGEYRFNTSTAGGGVAGDAITFTQAMTLDASGRLLVGPTSANANGGILQLSSGITFPATQVASSDVNTLDDYREGTWSPTITAGSGTPTTVTVNSSTYTKIGRMVVCTFDISIVAVGTAASSLQFGLPFTSITSTAFCGSFREDGSTGNMGMVFYSTGTTAACLLYNNATPWVNGYRLKGTYTYFAA
jgi:hypothetical protein